MNVIISPSYVKFGKEGKLAEVVNEIGDKRQGVCVLYCMFVEIAVILDQSKFSVLFLMKKKGEACGDFDGRSRPVFKILSMNVRQAVSSSGFSGYSLATLGVKDSLRSMAWSKSHCGGRASKVCSENTSVYSEYC